MFYLYVSRVEWQRTLTSFSESPLHLLTMLEAEMLKKVVLHSVATALASRVLPVPVCMWLRWSQEYLSGKGKSS